MKTHHQNKIFMTTVLLIAMALAMVWAVIQLRRAPADDSDWMVRLTLGVLLGFGLLFERPKGRGLAHPGLFDRRPGALSMLAAGAALFSILGLILNVHQFEWLGLVLLLYSVVRWVLPPEYRGNIKRAFFLFYWIHPLPGQIFGPFEMWMQNMSISGAEWMLHILNHRVWADGFVLRFGLVEFGVPEACSGMRTAVTVLLCSLGTSMLLRLRWYETVAFLVLGTLQVLALNIMRIVLIVHIATRSDITISETVLHDTAGIFLLVAIMLAQAELVWWQYFSRKRMALRRAVRSGNAELPKKSSYLPPFWRVVSRVSIWFLIAVFLAGAVALAAYKRRPSHRSAMYKEVVVSLVNEQPRTAERAVAVALRLTPGDRSLLTFELQALVGAEKYEQALVAAENLPEPLTPMEKALKGSTLASLGHLEEAAETLNALPEHVRRWPPLAIFIAEYAVRINDFETVCVFTRYAARTHLNIPRVRLLYSYLAARGRWSTIAETHHPLPYEDIGHALLAIHANLTVNRSETAGRILRQALEQWPDEIRLLEHLSRFAALHPDSEWEDRYEQNLRSSLDQLDADRLTIMIDAGFRMRRPDLSWLAWRRLQELDPSDPALWLSVARHASDWFVFRRRYVGMSAVDGFQTVDMRGHYRDRRSEPGFTAHWQQVPLADEMIDTPGNVIRERYLDRTLEELERRERAGELTVRMQRVFPVVLGMMGRIEESDERLNLLVAIHPEMRFEVMMQQALNYERRAKWQDSYELLRNYFEEVDFPGLRPRLMFINAALNIRLGHFAIQTAMDTVEMFPESFEAKTALAACWEGFGFTEQALFVFERVPRAPLAPFFPQLLFDSGRYQAARDLARSMGTTLRQEQQAARRPRVVPAEMSILRRPVEALTAEQMESATVTAERLAQAAQSPFVAALRRLEAQWFRSGGSEAASVAEDWMAVGRDPREAAAAAYNLAILLLRQSQAAAALDVVERGVAQMPAGLALWRLRVPLSEGDPEIVAAARKLYPDDPEFWLAELVVRVGNAIRDDGTIDPQTRDWVLQNIKSAAASKRFAPGEMVRAADYLLRHNLPDAAAPAARYAIAAGRGLETAYIVGLRCALVMRDFKWALSCALGGADHALDPKPFYQMLVNINFARGALDRDLVVALDYLKEQFPEDDVWAHQLGYVHFQQGDPARALGLLAPILQRDDLREVRISTIILAAEAARVDGRPHHAVNILEAGLNVYSGNLALLNNLIYILANDPQTLSRAMRLMPELVRIGGETPEVMDTIAVVYLKNGQLDRAEMYLQRALDNIDKNSYAYPLVQATLADLLIARGDYQEGLEVIRAAASHPDVAPSVQPDMTRRVISVWQAVINLRIEEARELQLQGKWERAADVLAELLRSPYISETQTRTIRRMRQR